MQLFWDTFIYCLENLWQLLFYLIFYMYMFVDTTDLQNRHFNICWCKVSHLIGTNYIVDIPVDYFFIFFPLFGDILFALTVYLFYRRTNFFSRITNKKTFPGVMALSWFIHMLIVCSSYSVQFVRSKQMLLTRLISHYFYFI